MANKSKKEHILTVASDLFNKQGIRATGVDQVVSESNIAKMTLYNHFRSKDELVLAYLMKYDDQWRKRFEDSVNKTAKTPRDKLLAVFDMLGEWFEEPEFNGCVYIKTASEFMDHSHPYYEAARNYKSFMKKYIDSVIHECQSSNPEALSSGLSLLVEGAITSAMLQTDPKPAEHARDTARVIIDYYLQSK